MNQNFANLSREEKQQLLARLMREKAAKKQQQPRTVALSQEQEGIWFACRHGEASRAYNVMFALRVDDVLDRHALQQAVTTWVNRHDVLRTVYRFENERPVAVIQPKVKPDFEGIDASGYSEAQLDDLLAEQADIPFDLDAGPVIRFRHYAISEKEHIFLVVVHHIAADLMCINILLEELAPLYEAALAGKQASLPPLPTNYAAYAAKQKARLDGTEGASLRKYWTQQLVGLDEPLELPADRPRNNQSGYATHTHTLKLPSELLGKLENLSRNQGTTLYMTVLAAFKVWLHRISGRTDLAVASPVVGRTETGLDKVMGCFADFAVLRTDFSGNPTWQEALGRVRETVLGALAHGGYPFTALVDDLRPAREPGRPPFAQVAFAWEKSHGNTSAFSFRAADDPTPAPATTWGNLSVRPHVISQRGSLFDLTVLAFEASNDLKLVFQYNPTRFDATTISRFAAHFQHLLTGLVQGNDALHRFSLMDTRENARWHAATDNEKPSTEAICFHKIFAEVAQEYAQVEALRYVDQGITYASLQARVNQLAHRLVALGVGPDVPVGVCFERSPDMFVALLAVLHAGGAYVPMNPDLPQDRLALMIEDSKMAVLLTQDHLLGQLPETSIPVLCPQSMDLSDVPATAPEVVVFPDNPAYIIYTSGSTGKPKGVWVTHRGLDRMSAAQRRTFAVSQGDRVLQFASITFDAATFEMAMALCAGATLCIADKETLMPGPDLVTFLQEEKINLVTLPPSALANLPDCDLPDLHTITVAGEACGAGLVNRWAPGRRFFNLYGPTETTIWASAHQCEVGEAKPSIGKAVANLRTLVTDKYLQAQPVGISGELCVAGEGLARGYLGRPALTAEKFVPNPYGNGTRLYRTGDMVRYLPNEEQAPSDMDFIGRVDFQVKVRGFRVEPGEIEAVLTALPDVKEACVLAQGSGARAHLVAFVAAEANCNATKESLRSQLAERLPDYMVPSAFVLLDALPVTVHGKVDRRALKELAGEDKPGAYTPPRNPDEEILCATWAQVLEREQVGIYDHFYEIGGNSLAATQILTRVRDQFQVSLTLQAFLEQACVADLAAAIRRLRREGSVASLPPIRPREDASQPALSFAQQRLWFLDQLVPDNPYYNMPFAVRLEGELNRDALHQALCEIANRHDALRTRFPSQGGEPIQVIDGDYQLPFQEIDLTHHSESEREERALALCKEEVTRVFNLAEDNLFRVMLLLLAPETHILVINVHHIISDGWSVGVTLRELNTLYNAFRKGESSPLATLPIQYADFAAWQTAWLEGDVYNHQLDYWRGKLDDLTPLQLQTDFPRPKVERFQGDKYFFQLTPELSSAVSELSRVRGASMFMTLLAGFQALLHRYSGQNDIVVGTGIANRNHGGIEDLIGFFVNLLVLRADTSGNPFFSSFLDQVRQVCLEAFDHQDLPFEKLMDELSPDRDLSGNPLCQVMFVFQNFPMPGLELDGLQGTAVLENIDTGTSKFDMTLFMWLDGDVIRGLWEYNTDLFQRSTIDKMAGHFQTLLRAFAKTPIQAIDTVPVLSEAEREQILVDWNDTTHEVPAGLSILGLYDAQVRTHPEDHAVARAGGNITYGELDRRANILAHHLQTMGAGPEIRIGLCADRSLESAVAILAILKAGSAYVPIDPDYPEERITYMMEDSAVPVLLGRAQHLTDLPEHSAQVVCIDEGWDALANQYPETPPASKADEDNAAYIIYTSGSTGKPKGVMVGRRNLLYSTMSRHQYYDEVPTGYLLLSALAFDSSVAGVFWTWTMGGTLIFPPQNLQEDVLAVIDLVAEWQASHLLGIPSFYELLLNHAPEGRMACLKAAIVAGEACPPDLIETHRKALPNTKLYNEYGPTEGTVWCTVYDTDQMQPDAVTVPIGPPIPNMRAYLLSPQGLPVPAGVPGEICIGGPGITRGYHQRPGLTATRFVPDPFEGEGARLYRTGDLGRHAPDGSIIFMGRIDQQVKVRGFRIELEEIEAVMRRHEAVGEAAVTVYNPGDGGQLVGYVVQNPDYQLDDESTDRNQDHVDEWLQLYEQLYSKPAPTNDPTFNIMGWDSSFSGEPLSEDEMRLWVDSTVARIVAEQPRSVLELGCGSGLMLFSTAPHCERYHGTDFSKHSTDYIRPIAAERGLDHVTLDAHPADDLSRIAHNDFDTVVLNSVIQYFPGIDYLRKTLEGVIEKLSQGGKVFIGDVRHRGLLEAFHADVQCYGEEGSRAEISKQVRQQLAREQEMAVDPEFFLALARTNPRISGVRIRLKEGRYLNEMTRFRYDVNLFLDGEQQAQPTVEPRSWSAEAWSLERLGEHLSSNEESLWLQGLPNKRTARAVARTNWLRSTEPEPMPGNEVGGIDPQDVVELAAQFGLTAELTWSRSGDGSFDVYLSRSGDVPALHIIEKQEETVDWNRFANNPLQGKFARYLIPQLREFLGEELPTYMVPTNFVLMETMPLTPNGKINRKALPEPERNRTAVAGPYTAPRTPIEEALASIWAEVLRLERVGVKDNFFEMGGDSILSIQVVARAHARGLTLTPKQLFQNQTIAELAGVVSEEGIDAQQGTVTGEHPLTPIQRWFFERNSSNPHHWNQAVLLQSDARITPEILNQCATTLVAQHDALRSRFPEKGLPFFTETETANLVSSHDLSALDEASALAEIEKRCAHYQTDLNIANGPQMRLVHFNLGPNTPGRVFWVIHHLVVDGVSWRILLEDLQRFSQQALAGEAPNPVPKTTAYTQWASQLSEDGRSNRPTEHLAYWEQIAKASVAPLPLDQPQGTNRESDATSVTFQLDAAQTQRILSGGVHAAYRTRINDLLLAALLRTFKEWTGSDKLVLNLEGHGREELFGNVNLSRTVGWFTAVYPVLLQADNSNEVSADLKAVKEALRAIPNNGIDYGVLRYLSGQEQLATHPNVSFNYLGQFDQAGGEEALYQLANEDYGPLFHGEDARETQVHVNGMVVEGCMRFDWTFSKEQFETNTIETLAQNFETNLQALVDHCLIPGVGSYTPSDFPLANLDAPTLDKLIATHEDVEDIYPLAPIQEGMLFHALYEPESPQYQEQVILTVQGDVQPEKLQRAFASVIAKHPVLRTAFVTEGVPKPLQIVKKTASMHTEVLDWREFSAVTDKLEVLLDERRATGYNLQQAPLMRLDLIRREDTTWDLVWHHHHLIVDGWSGSIVLQEAFAAYEALTKGRAIQVGKAKPYRDFIAWLSAKERDASISENFWRNNLAGLMEPTPLPLGASDQVGDSFDKVELTFEDELAETLQASAQQHRLTLNTYLQGAWAFLLSRYTDRSEVVYGSVFSGRPVALDEVETIAGPFVNTLPVRLGIDLDATILDWLTELQTHFSELRNHEHNPQSQIRKWSSLPYGTDLFRSIFTFENYPIDEAMQRQVGGLDLAGIRYTGKTNFPLSIMAGVVPHLGVSAIFDATAFQRQSIETLLADYGTVLREMSSHPHQVLDEINIRPEDATIEEPATLQSDEAELFDF